MMTISSRWVGLLAGVVWLSSSAASAQGGSFQLVHQPGGGEIVYGPLANTDSLAAAAGAMLRSVHGHFGDRPQIGRLFQAKGSNSLSTFFSVTDKNGSHRAVTGLMIVAITPGGTAEGAVVFDDAAHFGVSEAGMMKKLNEVWHPGGAGGGEKGGASGALSPLRETPFPDNSGSVGLPAGWRITGGYQGSVHAVGPTGSEIHYGVTVPVMDSNNPQTRMMIQRETQGGRVPLPGMYVAIPYGTDPVHAYLAASAQIGVKSHQPQITFTPSATKHLGRGGGGGDCTLATGTMDRHDGKGEMYSETTICMSPPTAGNWILTLYQANIKPDLVAQEKPTLEAISKTYKLNGAVIDSETQATISHIHDIGAQAAAQAKASHEAFDDKLAADRANADIVDRSNQNFSNYILDRSVVQDTQTGERGTVYNKYADSLVQNDPTRFQYVPTQDMLKGIDY